MQRLRWCIFYADGSTFSFEDGLPEAAPYVGVIAIVCDVEDHGVQIHHQADFYWRRENTWQAGDIHGLVDQSARFGATWVKQGQTVHPVEYAEIIGAAATLKEEWEA